MNIGDQWGTYAGAWALCLAFGLLYALLTHWMREKGHLRGVTSYQVMWGVIITLTINKLIHNIDPLTDYILELITFAFTGLPMLVQGRLPIGKEGSKTSNNYEES